MPVSKAIFTLVPTLSVEETSIGSAISLSEEILNMPPNCPNPPTTSLVNVVLTISPIRNQDNVIVGVSKIARDITELKLSQETQSLLMRELNHRSKNLLAVADAIVRQAKSG